MMTQTVLPFKLEASEEILTPHAGLIVFGEFLYGLKLNDALSGALPGPGSGAGFLPSQFVLPLIVMLHGGGRSLEDLRVLREDKGLRELLGWDEFPSSDAVGDWLARKSGLTLNGLALVNRREVIQRTLKNDGFDDYTLDIDASQLIAEKKAAQWTYKGERGYMPIIGHLAEHRLILADEFRAGNEAPASRNLEFIQYCVSQLPRGKKIKRLRADSAAYQAKIFNWCEESEHDPVLFAIGADQDVAVKKAINAIPPNAWRGFEDDEIAETVHAMEKTKKAFRLIIIRHGKQGELFENGYRYHVIASNRTDSPETIVKWYRQRGNISENGIKELKIGFGMERMPCGTQDANAVFFRIGTLAYNLFILFQQKLLQQTKQRSHVQTVRWQLYNTAGKIVHHAGRLILKMPPTLYEWCAQLRQRSAQFAFSSA